jgi:hypothetical protein
VRLDHLLSRESGGVLSERHTFQVDCRFWRNLELIKSEREMRKHERAARQNASRRKPKLSSRKASLG